MLLKLYNTLTRKLEELKTREPNIATFYSCGPTVYHFAHIGNLRTYMSADVIKRVLTANGINVRHIMNLTDVGHLTDDGDYGQDKMEKGAAREGKSAWDVAKFYTDQFMRDVADLNIIPPLEFTRATDFIPQQIAMV
ncbi:MAG: class I tRNA ligase family protein, partial [Alphaproteobacteria bacterium]|nr:class I tRNA ligase family protein [Alphaproteobacteria bacterium]